MTLTSREQQLANVSIRIPGGHANPGTGVIFMPQRQLSDTDLYVHPLCLGGNVWGWTADESTSFAVLDAYAAAGGNFLDTADSYSKWLPGHVGGESEVIMGKWMASRGNRDNMVVTTKVFGHPENPGLSPQSIKRACEASLRRLQTDHVDVYLAHYEDPAVPLEESLRAFSELIEEGKVRVIGASNFSPTALANALAISRENGLASFRIIQDHYNLMERRYESTLRPLALENGLAQTPYMALASGFLTGKHRPGATPDSARYSGAAGAIPSGMQQHMDERGMATLAALDEVAQAHDCEVATVALAWLISQPTVPAVIASARLTEQLPPLLAVSDLRLSDEELQTLDFASRADDD